MPILQMSTLKTEDANLAPSYTAKDLGFMSRQSDSGGWVLIHPGNHPELC